MTAYYSFLGLILQGILVNILFAFTPAEGQNLRDIKVSVKAIDVTLEDAFKLIEGKTNFKFLYNDQQIPLNAKATVVVEEESLYNILEVFARDYGLTFNRINNQIVVKKNLEQTENLVTAVETGTIKGRIREVNTKTVIPGASIQIKGLNLGAIANVDGSYVIQNVPLGKQTLLVSAVGYGKIGIDIFIKADEELIHDCYLTESAVGLDEVVITGVNSETRRKEIPADISVVTAKQIEEKNPLTFADAIKGKIPGLFSLTNGQLDYSSAIYIRGRGYAISGSIPAVPLGTPGISQQVATGGVDVAKIYIDGIELANPQLLSTLDPNNIERIEVIRGPHAATLYGSQAMSGVIQIITKKGKNIGLDRPSINASFSTGYIESPYTASSDVPMQSNSNIQLNGSSNQSSYNLGLSYSTVGAWLPNNDSKTWNLNGGFKVVLGPLAATLTGTYGNRIFKFPTSTYIYDRWPGLAPTPYKPGGTLYGQPYPNNQQRYDQFILGLNISYVPTKNWYNNLVIGQDNMVQEDRLLKPNFTTATDTTQYLTQNIYNRRSIRFSSTYQVDFSDDFSSKVSAGMEYQQYSYIYNNATGIKFNKYDDILASPAGTKSFTKSNYWYGGFNGMLELGYLNKLFFTVSISNKQDPRGYELNYITPPRLGISYNDDFGELEYRLRGQYGSSIQPLDPLKVDGSATASNIYLPNPDLIPAKRTGWDAGIELFYDKDAASLSFTYYNEKSEDEVLVQLIDGTKTPKVLQYQNLGSCDIKGIEVQASWNLNSIGFPAKLNANYTFSDNIMVSTSNQYVPSPTMPIQNGDRVLYTPKNSGGGSISTILFGVNLAFDCQFSGGWRNYDWAAWNDYRYGTAVHRDGGDTYANLPTAIIINGVSVNKSSITRSYIVDYPTYWKFGLRGDYKVSSLFTVFVNISNLFNDSGSDVSNMFVSPGRTTTIGFKLNY
jgi:outer membrane receptor protein involved in Fe transport